MLTVQYPENQVQDADRSAGDSAARRRAARCRRGWTRSATFTRIKSPTEVDHYQLRRVIDIYVRPLDEDLGRIANAIDGIIAAHEGARRAAASTLRGMVQGMRASFTQLRPRPDAWRWCCCT